MSADGVTMSEVLSRLGRLEARASLDQAQPYSNPQAITAIERRIVQIENVAKQIVNGALVPQLRQLSDRVNSIGTAMDQALIPEVDAVVLQANTTQNALQDLTTQLTAFPAQIQAEIANAMAGLNNRVDHWSSVLNAAQNGAMLPQGTGKGGFRKLITEYRIIDSQGKLSNLTEKKILHYYGEIMRKRNATT